MLQIVCSPCDLGAWSASDVTFHLLKRVQLLPGVVTSNPLLNPTAYLYSSMLLELVQVWFWGAASVPPGYLSFGPILKYYVFYDVCVREKAWRGKSGLERMHNTLSHGSQA